MVLAGHVHVSVVEQLVEVVADGLTTIVWRENGHR